jgi:hypothetical protein
LLVAEFAARYGEAVIQDGCGRWFFIVDEAVNTPRHYVQSHFAGPGKSNKNVEIPEFQESSAKPDSDRTSTQTVRYSE